MHILRVKRPDFPKLIATHNLWCFSPHQTEGVSVLLVTLLPSELVSLLLELAAQTGLPEELGPGRERARSHFLLGNRLSAIMPLLLLPCIRLRLRLLPLRLRPRLGRLGPGPLDQKSYIASKAKVLPLEEVLKSLFLAQKRCQKRVIQKVHQ